MNNIVFFDLEVNNKGYIVDIGATTDGISVFRGKQAQYFYNYIQGKKYVVAHNFFAHDAKYVSFPKQQVPIDTLVWSPLLFPKKPYHNLVKDDKLVGTDPNNPVTDSKKAMHLFYELVTAFNGLPTIEKEIYYLLLSKYKEYSGFFNFVDFKVRFKNLKALIYQQFGDYFCNNAPLNYYIRNNPIELAYALSIIRFTKDSLTPKWVNRTYPKVRDIIHELRGTPCHKGCKYCDIHLNADKALKDFFGYDKYRDLKGKPLQRNAVIDGISGKSLLVVFPTGVGKSITFQLPALIAGIAEGGLTVVISPLQALMKDQVDSLLNKSIGGVNATTINGSLNPIQRKIAFESVRDGKAHILYIAPEMLRSKSIETLLLQRNVIRFVIDEAHCFSSWGQDFRIEYQYVGKFIKKIEEERKMKIPVSCFTATAKPQVIDDIKEYFKEHLGVNFIEHIYSGSRENLTFEVKLVKNDEDRYQQLRNLIESCSEPTIVYVNRTKLCEKLAYKLIDDGYPATYFHGKVDKNQKVINQDEFIKGDVNIIVATNAFGMGIDKDDVKMVIHYNISSSLEDYVQEAGRAGRKEDSHAKCYVLYNKDDLNNHFSLLQKSKLLQTEIQQVWRILKKLSEKRKSFNITPFELAEAAGFSDPKGAEIKIRTAVNELERTGYLERGQNNPTIFGNSLSVSNIEEALEKFADSPQLTEKENSEAARYIVSKLLTTKMTSRDDPTAKIDYLASELGIEKTTLIQLVNWLREVGVIEDHTDLESYVGAMSQRTLENRLETIRELEQHLYLKIKEEPTLVNFKDIVEYFIDEKKKQRVNILLITTLTNHLVQEGLLVADERIKRNLIRYHWAKNVNEIKKDRETLFDLSLKTISFLHERANAIKQEKQEEVTVTFSLKNIQNYYSNDLFDKKVNYDTIMRSLNFMSFNKLIRLDGAFFVYYNAMRIQINDKRRTESYKIDDYSRLNQYYDHKIAQIHIVGEYAERLSKDPEDAAAYVFDYFNMPFNDFKAKHFKGRLKMLKYPRTKELYDRVFNELSPKQAEIIESKAKVVTVFAGPGSGKTRLLVHKLASLAILDPDFKNEDILMLTFSNAAATEFKLRLKELIGEQYKYVQINTFHSYAFDILSITGDKEKSDGIVKEAVEKIHNNEVEQNRITKNVLLIDEAQDMSEDEFALVKALMEKNSDMRVIAVGDDDQNIYEFRKSNSAYFGQLREEKNAASFELIDNYRSKDNLVKFTNKFVGHIKTRMKVNPINAFSKELGNIEVTKYYKRPFVRGVVTDILSKNLQGSIGVLTRTNDDASQIYTELVNAGKEAKLLRKDIRFKLFNLFELRTFYGYFEDSNTIITDSEWDNAIGNLIKNFEDNELLDGILKLLNDFRVTNDIIYLSDFKQFLLQTELTDLNRNSREQIIISTMHQSKGREFDHVFMYVDLNNKIEAEDYRVMYVAMTRAKSNLFIHVNNRTLFDFSSIENVTNNRNRDEHEPIEEIIVELDPSDVYLGSFKRNQEFIKKNLKQGCKLEIDNDGLRYNNFFVFYFSNAFKEQLFKRSEAHYFPVSAYVNYLVFWYDLQEQKEYLIVLPKIYFLKSAEVENVEDQVIDVS